MDKLKDVLLCFSCIQFLQQLRESSFIIANENCKNIEAFVMAYHHKNVFKCKRIAKLLIVFSAVAIHN